MAKQIKKNDIIEKDIFKNLIDSADASITKLKLMNDQFVTMAKTIKSSMKTAKFDTTKELNEFIKATKNATTVSKEQAKAIQEIEKANALKAKATEALIRAEKEELKLQEQAIKTSRTKLTDDEKQAKIDAKKQKSIDDEANAYKRLEKNTRDLKNQSKQLGAELLELERDGKKNTKEFNNLERKLKDVTTQAQKGDKALKKLDGTVGDNFRNVGNYKSGLDKLQSGLGALGIAFGISNVVRSAGSTIIDFDKSIADLVSITGASGKDLEYFKKQSIELGRGVEGGAKNVIEAYKLIGSAKPELLENAEALNMVTESAIKLSHASGLELPDAATRLTDAMNQFNAPAEKAGEFINVLANGALYGAAEIPQVTESLLQFGAVAKTSNVSIQESTALIEMLASKGVKGAEAGTALRNVMLKLSAPDALPKKAKDYLAEMGIDMKKLSDTSVPFSERLKALTPILNNEAAQVKMFGLENVVAAKNLLLNVDGIEKLTKQMETKGTVDAQAEARTKTLTQSLIELQGSWEAWILGVNEGTGASNDFGEIIDFLADNLGTILDMVMLLTEIWIKYKIITIAQIGVNKLLASSFSSVVKEQGVVKGALNGITTSFGKLGSFLKSNAIGIAIFAIVSAFKALHDIVSVVSEGSEKYKELQGEISELHKGTAEKIGKEKGELELLVAEIKLHNAGSKERGELLQTMNDKYGTHLQNISDETQANKLLEDSMKKVIKQMEVQIRLQAKKDEFVKVVTALQSAEEEYAPIAKKMKQSLGTDAEVNKLIAKLFSQANINEATRIKMNALSIADKRLYLSEYGLAAKDLDKKLLVQKLTADKLKLEKEIGTQLEKNAKEADKVVTPLKEIPRVIVGGTGGAKTALVELDTTFKDINKTISEQVSLLNELDNIYKNRTIDLKTDEAKAEYDKQVKLASEFGLSIKGIYEGGASVDKIKQLVEEENTLKKEQAKANLLFRINQLEQEYNAVVAEKQKELDLEKLTLLAQKGITPKAKEEIEANYLIKQKELDAELLISHKDMETKKELATEASADAIVALEKEKAIKIKDYNEGVYDAAKTHGEKLTAAAEEVATATDKTTDDELAKRKKHYEDLNKLAQMSATYFIKQSDKKIAQTQIELDALSAQKNFLEQLAVNGNITAEKSLAQNEKLTIEQNKKKAKEIKKQERIKLAESVFTSYTANVANKEKNPIIKTIGDISVLTAFINSLPTFYTGTERTVGESLGKPQLNGRDGHIIRVDGSEKILNPTLSKMTGNLTTLEIAQLAEDKLRGRIMSKGGSNIQILETNYSNDVIVEKLDQLNNTILNKPETNIEVGEILGGVMHVVNSTKNTRQTVRNITRFS